MGAESKRLPSLPGGSPQWVHGCSEFKDLLRIAWDLARRDLAAKYRRSVIGPLWLVLSPLCFLGIYSLVFGQLFAVQWDMPLQGKGSDSGFVLPFFVGLAAYLTLADVVNSSAAVFVNKRMYVAKSPFPIWVLWVADLMRAAIHAGVLMTLVLLLALTERRLALVGLLWLPLSLLICTVFISACSLLLAVLGPFIGDISEVARLLLRGLFYAAPVTYPLSLVPMPYRDWMWWNPLTCMVELLRAPIVFGQMPSPTLLASFGLASLVLGGLSTWVFLRVRWVIADVV